MTDILRKNPTTSISLVKARELCVGPAVRAVSRLFLTFAAKSPS
jgi:hypothetical protein